MPFFSEDPPPPSPPPENGEAQDAVAPAARDATAYGTEAQEPAAPAIPLRPPRPTSKGKSTYLILLGAKGQGKTTYARAVWWARKRAGGSGVFFDPKAENGDMGTVCRNVGELAQVVGRRPFSAVVQLGWGQKGEDLWPLVFATGHLLLVLDEAQDYANRHTPDSSGVIQIVGKGRSRAIDLFDHHPHPSRASQADQRQSRCGGDLPAIRA